ncbi:TOBE domain-containing protein [bacterium]|jgi:molybdate transport system regulatory protein|nr:TOBE domain-containing protein [bacterium]
MNRLSATITDIKSVDSINVVSFDVAKRTMKMMSLELNEALVVGSKVLLGAKATNIALAKEANPMLSISNQLDVTIARIDMGALLCSVKFDFGGHLLESIITRDSALKMQLTVGDTIVALIKSSELSIVEVLT